MNKTVSPLNKTTIVIKTNAVKQQRKFTMRHFITAAAVIGFSLAISAYFPEAANRGTGSRDGSNSPSSHNSLNMSGSKFYYSSHFDYGRHGL